MTSGCMAKYLLILTNKFIKKHYETSYYFILNQNLFKKSFFIKMWKKNFNHSNLDKTYTYLKKIKSVIYRISTYQGIR